MSAFVVQAYGLHRNRNISGHGLLAIKDGVGVVSIAGHNGLSIDFDEPDSVYTFPISGGLCTVAPGVRPPILATTIIPKDIR